MSHFNKQAYAFNGDVKAVNYGEKLPRIKGLTLRSLRVTYVTRGEDKKLYFPCQKCGGEGEWDSPHAIDDRFSAEAGKKTCFACGGRGWFRVPEQNWYFQFCLTWVLTALDENRAQAVVNVARSEIKWCEEFAEKDGPEGYLRAVADFWKEVLGRMIRRRDEGLPFINEGEASNKSFVQSALITFERNHKRRGVDPLADLVKAGWDRYLLLALSRGWSNNG